MIANGIDTDSLASLESEAKENEKKAACPSGFNAVEELKLG